MAKRKPIITIEDFKDDWADAYAKLLRNRKFQQAIHNDGMEDSMETLWLIGKLMQDRGKHLAGTAPGCPKID